MQSPNRPPAGNADAPQYRELTELTLSHVALGGLTEAGAMDLIGNAHCHRLTEGTGHSIRGIVDPAGRTVYPGYYYTKFEIPSHCPLGAHRVWDSVAVEIDVRRYGALLLASRATLSGVSARGAEEPTDAERNEDAATLLACNSFYVDHPGAGKEPIAPKPGAVAALPSLRDASWAAQVQHVPRTFQESQSRGSIDPAFEANVSGAAVVRYVPRFGADMPWGEHIAFSRYATISAALERDYLESLTGADPFPTAALAWCETLHRETVYCATIAEESPLLACMRMRLSVGSNHAAPPGRLVSAELESVVDVRRASDDALVLSSKALRVVALPERLADLDQRLRRWCATVR